MLQRIEVDGFRSLRDFELDFLPGLNVLIGPNGAGKTNVIKFLELMSDFVEGYLPDAISKSGGAGVTFNRSDLENERGKISAQVSGYYDLRPYLEKRHKNTSAKIKPKSFVSYRYEFEIQLRENSVLFSYQRLTCKLFAKKPSKRINEDQVDIDVSWNEASDGNPPDFKVHTSDSAKELETRSLDDRIEWLTSKIQESKDLAVAPLFVVTTYIFSLPLWGIARDLSSGRAFNINPTRVREPEDIGQSSGITFDGGGLASTLYNLQQAKDTKIGFYPAWRGTSIQFRPNAESLLQE